MYWNLNSIQIAQRGKININMRCIEITSSDTFKKGFKGLTLTWDVLKSWTGLLSC